MSKPLLEIEGLTIVFPGGRGSLPWQKQPDVRAVQDARWANPGRVRPRSVGQCSDS